MAVFDKLKNSTGEFSTILNHAAEQVGRGETNVATATNAAYAEILDAIPRVARGQTETNPSTSTVGDRGRQLPATETHTNAAYAEILDAIPRVARGQTETNPSTSTVGDRGRQLPATETQAVGTQAATEGFALTPPTEKAASVGTEDVQSEMFSMSEVAGTGPTIARDVDRETAETDAPLFSKAAQTERPEQTVLPEPVALAGVAAEQFKLLTRPMTNRRQVNSATVAKADSQSIIAHLESQGFVAETKDKGERVEIRSYPKVKANFEGMPTQAERAKEQYAYMDFNRTTSWYYELYNKT